MNKILFILRCYSGFESSIINKNAIFRLDNSNNVNEIAKAIIFLTKNEKIRKKYS